MKPSDHPHSGRKPHYRKIRRHGFRELLMSKGWGMKGAFAEKRIHGKYVICSTVREEEDHILCCFRLKQDIFAKGVRSHIEKKAQERRKSFRVLRPSTGEGK